MILWPYETESIFVSLSGEAILNRIVAVTTMEPLTPTLAKEGFQFSGVANSDHFTISLLLNRPVTFIPRVRGEFQDASKGSILFLEYSMFPATRLYLAFWTSFMILASVVLYFQFQNFWGAPTVLMVAIASLWIARANFLFQVRRTRRTLLEVLSVENL